MMRRYVIGTSERDIACLLLRMALGSMYVAHALFKICVLGWPVTIKLFASTGIPELLVYPMVVIELLGGALLILGLAVRCVSLLLMPMLIGAIVFVHGGHGWIYTSPGGGWEYPASLLVLSAAVVCLGSGRSSLHQRVLGKWCG